MNTKIAMLKLIALNALENISYKFNLPNIKCIKHNSKISWIAAVIRIV